MSNRTLSLVCAVMLLVPLGLAAGTLGPLGCAADDVAEPVATRAADEDCEYYGDCECEDASDCDDNNPCTTDSCDAYGDCQHTNVADGTECTSDNNECTHDRCASGSCAHPNKPDRTACSDEPNANTTDVCCSGACTHKMSTVYRYRSTPVPIYDPRNQRRNPDGTRANACKIGDVVVVMEGPGAGSLAGGSYTAHAEITPAPRVTDPRDPCSDADMAAVLQSLDGIGGMTYSGGHLSFPSITLSPGGCRGGMASQSQVTTMEGSTLTISASVTVGTGCECYITSVSGSGSVSFTGPDNRDRTRPGP